MYIKAHPNVENYVAIDDLPLHILLGENAVLTEDIMTAEHADKCIEILNR